MDGTRKMGESLARPATAPGAARVDGGALVGQVLAEQQVRHLFTINGGHIWPILSHLREHGIQMIHMRHEQSCAYAADAYARTSGHPGVLSVTAGCGLTNAVTGLCVAGLTGSPVVCLAGQHPTTEDQLGSFQEAYGVEIQPPLPLVSRLLLEKTTTTPGLIPDCPPCGDTIRASIETVPPRRISTLPVTANRTR